MNFHFNKKMTKANFENDLMKLVEKLSGKDPVEIVYKSKHTEHDGTVVWLYYWKTSGNDSTTILDPHIGSWSKGSGWAYKFDGEGNVNYHDKVA